MKKLLLLIVVLVMIQPVTAAIDLIAPTDNFVTSNDTVNFEYFPSVPNIGQCTINAGIYNFPDPNTQNTTINSVTIQGINDGTYDWNVTCESGNTSQISQTRTFTVDTVNPSLNVITPVQGETQTTLELDIAPEDNVDQELLCEVYWNEELIDSPEMVVDVHFIKQYSVAPGNYELRIICSDDAGNLAEETIQVNLEPEMFLTLELEETNYGITEQVILTVDSIPYSNLSIDVCPNQQGFVECVSAIIVTDHFPQEITLPAMNRTGEYLIEGFAEYGGQTELETLTYTIDNSMAVQLRADGPPKKGKSFVLTATASGGIAPYRFVWRMSNGSIIETDNTIEINYSGIGQYIENVTVYDAALNQKSKSIALNVDPVYTVNIFVQDNETSTPVPGAEVEFAGQSGETAPDGKVKFEVGSGSHTLFISKAGYEYYLWELSINRSEDFLVKIAKSSDAPDVTITSPLEGESFSGTTFITYNVRHDRPTACTLYLAENGDWYLENGTKRHDAPGQYTFERNYGIGKYEIKVECEDQLGVVKVSEDVSFSVVESIQEPAETTPQKTAPSELDLAIEGINKVLESYDTAPADVQQVMRILEFDKRLRNTKRAIQQAARDIDALSYRGLTQEEIDDEANKILKKTEDLLANTPIGIEVLNKRTYVQYVEEEDLDDVFEMLSDVQGWKDSKKIRKKILENQQKFTVSSKIYEVQLKFPGNKQDTVTAVKRGFTFKDGLGDDYHILELIPKEVVESTEEMDLPAGSEVIKSDPVILFKKTNEYAFVINKKIDFILVEEIHTMLAQESLDTGTQVDAFVLLPTGLAALTWPVILLMLLVAIIYLAYHFNLLHKIPYIVYKLRRNEKVHYLRVIIGDAEDYLDTQDYEKADMLYKEIRMTYDTLNTPARNDLYDDVMNLVHKLDAYYFNTVMMELDRQLKSGDMQGAIESYEKLTGTFERLDPERQKKLVDAVVGMGKRLGLEVPA